MRGFTLPFIHESCSLPSSSLSLSLSLSLCQACPCGVARDQACGANLQNNCITRDGASSVNMRVHVVLLSYTDQNAKIIVEQG